MWGGSRPERTMQHRAFGQRVGKVQRFMQGPRSWQWSLSQGPRSGQWSVGQGARVLAVVGQQRFRKFSTPG
jgi:hypothetical protein